MVTKLKETSRLAKSLPDYSGSIITRLYRSIVIHLEWVYLKVKFGTQKKQKEIIRSNSYTIDKYSVISLSTRVDRRKFMTAQFKDQQIDYEYEDAVNGKVLKIEETPKDLVSAQSLSALPAGHIGCILSHMNVWAKMISSNWKHLCVIEDDAQLAPNFKEKLKNYLNETPEDYDILIISSCSTIYRRRTVSKHVFAPYNLCCTSAYIVSRKGAEKLLSLVAPFDLTSGGIDIKISELIKKKSIKAYHTDPMLCHQSVGLTSDIDENFFL